MTSAKEQVRGFEYSISKKHIERGGQKWGNDEEKRYSGVVCIDREPYTEVHRFADPKIRSLAWPSR
jgi:hypothetical protein